MEENNVTQNSLNNPPPTGLSDIYAFKYNDLRTFFEENDFPTVFDYKTKKPNEDEQSSFNKDLLELIAEPQKKERAVLGIDIYEYSHFDYEPQKLIPFVFSLLIEKATNFFFNTESFFSNRYNRETFIQNLIHTGDGGFLIFHNPLDAIVFLLDFNTFLHLFNAYHLFPKLRNFVGPITVRYSITYNKLYKIDSNFFGPAIINNARIISKDKLNRLLIDGKTYEWFLLNTKGIENLSITCLSDLNHIETNNNRLNPLTSIFFQQVPPSHIRNVLCQKLGKIPIKNDSFDVFNVMIQSEINLYDTTDKSKNFDLITSVGNMNCNGIESSAGPADTQK